MASAPSGAEAIQAVADDATELREVFAAMAARLVAVRADIEVVEYVLPAGSVAGRRVARARHVLAEVATVATLRAVAP